MEYPKKSVSGDAGEYLVAFKFTKLFKWPYRMLSVDLGVDGEVEIINSDGTSSSDIIKVQVKSFDSITGLSSKSIYVSANHINYWKKFCLPIIVVCVDLSKETVYWKAVTATESYRSGGKSDVISIDLKLDELTEASKSELLKLVIPSESKNIENILADARALHEEILEQSTFAVDSDQLTQVEGLFDKFAEKIALFEEVVRHFPWRAGLLTLREVAIMKRNAQITLNDAIRSYNVGLNGM